ncbi:hypothetical protein DY000_02041099 [Brassica cretica]|uniref:Uncharacterized protein n=1 Tax=Brassica cretica TaxID=69181 RepID=A0ABQ7BPW8_BRACR|nr:hypothetical protein DY000_02041099 [Brassica cretica]
MGRGETGRAACTRVVASPLLAFCFLCKIWGIDVNGSWFGRTGWDLCGIQDHA